MRVQRVLFRAFAAVTCGTIVAFFFLGDLIRIFEKPLESVHFDAVSVDVADAFMLNLKLAFHAGFLFSSPVLLWLLAGFVLPAVNQLQKKLLVPVIIGSMAVYLGGIVGGYEFILPKAVHFFDAWNEEHSFHLRRVLLGRYFSFVVNLLLACGLLCEGPFVILALAKLGLSKRLLSHKRSYAVVVLLVFVALISPSPDPFTFAVLAIPAVGVYEIGIWLVWLMDRRQEKQEELQH